MRTRVVWSVLVLGVLAALLVGAAVALFTDTQFTTGSVTSATAATIDLYICEPQPGGAGGPDCGPDDSANDEIIFETDEQLLTGLDDAVHWDVRLRNTSTGTAEWDLDTIRYSATETVDPGSDCNRLPRLDLRVLGKAGDRFNDNHVNVDTVVIGEGGAPIRAAFVVNEEFTNRVRAHVEVGDYEDMRVRVSLDSDVGDECQGNAWDISLAWTVVEH